MNTANTMPRPATVTNPPFCESSAGAPAVVDFTVPPVLVAEEEFVLPVALVAPELEADAFPVPAAFPLDVSFDEVLPVATVAPDSVALAVFPAFVFVEDWYHVNYGSDCILGAENYLRLSVDSGGCESNEENA